MNHYTIKSRLMIAVASVLVAFTLQAAENLELEKAKTWFRQGRLEPALSLLERLVATSTLSRHDRVEALEFLAFCNVAKQREDQVRKSFAEILALDASYEPRDTYLSHPAVMRAWLTARKQVLGTYHLDTSSSGIKTIAVLDFDNNSITDADKLANLGKGLADILITDLAALTELKVVERERIQFITEEIRRGEATIAGNRLADPEFAVRVGKLLGAQSLLIGSFIKLDKTLRLDVRLVKTETSEIIKTEFVEGKHEKIFDLARKLAIKISEDLEVAINKVEEENLDRLQRNEIPLEAAMAYSEALTMLDRQQYRDAKRMLARALAIAPDFKMARKKLELLQTFSSS